MDVVKYLKTLADPTRLRILALLRQEELSVYELQSITKMGQSRISTHLSILQEGSLVSARPHGRRTLYKFSPESLEKGLMQIVNTALDEADKLPEYANDCLNLKHVLALRTDETRLYFNQVAGRFDRQYGPGRSWQAFGQFLLKILPPMTIADLGSGEGLISELLAQTARKVIAVDNSAKIVNFGRTRVRKAKLNNVEFRLGDIEAPPIDPNSVDIALLSQVLHHLENPQKAIRAAYNILVPGGKIFILDLLQHDFSDAHTLYGDVTLGFSEGQLHQMLAAAGFTQIDIGITSREDTPPHFQTLLACATRAK